MDIQIQNLKSITIPVICLDLFVKNHPEHPIKAEMQKIKEQSIDNRYSIIKLKELMSLTDNEIKAIYNEIGSEEQYRNLYWGRMKMND